MFSIINDYSLLKIMFGNITELKDLALPPMDEIKKYKGDETLKKDREDFKFSSKDIDKLFALIPVDPKESKYAFEVLEFNAIMESLSNTVSPKTRRWGWWNTLGQLRDAIVSVVIVVATDAWHYGSILADAAVSYGAEAVTFLSDAMSVAVDFFYPPTTQDFTYDSDYYRGREDSADYVSVEYDKMAKLEQLMIALLIHTRYRVDFAIRQRKIRPAFKVVHQNYGWQVVRWYEKMVHLDQDLRDLCQLTYDTLDESAPDPNWNPKEREMKMGFIM